MAKMKGAELSETLKRNLLIYRVNNEEILSEIIDIWLTDKIIDEWCRKSDHGSHHFKLTIDIPTKFSHDMEVIQNLIKTVNLYRETVPLKTLKNPFAEFFMERISTLKCIEAIAENVICEVDCVYSDIGEILNAIRIAMETIFSVKVTIATRSTIIGTSHDFNFSIINQLPQQKR